MLVVPFHDISDKMVIQVTRQKEVEKEIKNADPWEIHFWRRLGSTQASDTPRERESVLELILSRMIMQRLQKRSLLTRQT
jgi:hypothetical protein